jgi:CRP/FNR family cyclic AMP-dependent transcriptional regulator
MWPGRQGAPHPAMSSVDDLPGWKELHGLTPAQVYPRGVELFSQGSPPDEVLYVDSGLVKLVRADRDGTETILGLAVAGAWLGSASAIVRAPSPVAAVTCTRVLLQRIPARVFCDLLEQDPNLSRLIHHAHARELCRQTSWLAQLTSLSSRERLERVIRQLILSLGLHASARGIRLQFPLRHWEIARLIAVTPEHLSRLLKQMQLDGLIHREKGWLIVPDVTRLCPVIEDGEVALWCEGGGTTSLDLRQDRD